MKRFSLCLGAAALAGCSIITSLDDYSFGGETDAGATDASMDAGDPGDAGTDAGVPCPTGCPTGQICYEPEGRCVECLEDAHCLLDTEPYCDNNGMPGMPGTCSPCVSDDACSSRTGQTVCDEASGACVLCTPDTEEAICGGVSQPTCQSSAGIFDCNGALWESLLPCDECLSDNECGLGPTNEEMVCIIDPLGLGRDTGRCAILPTTPPGDCPNGYRESRTAVSSLGVTVTVCLPHPNQAESCAAIVHERDARPCVVDSDCGDPEVMGDGVCDGTCQISCVGDIDCPAPLNTCNLSATPPYCT